MANARRREINIQSLRSIGADLQVSLNWMFDYIMDEDVDTSIFGDSEDDMDEASLSDFNDSFASDEDGLEFVWSNALALRVGNFFIEHPEVRIFLKSLGLFDHFPFFTLLLLSKVALGTLPCIAMFIGLLVTIHFSDMLIKKNVLLEEKRSTYGLLGVSINLFTNILLIFLLKCFYVQSSENAMELLWLAFIDDCSTKCMGMMVKICLAVMPATLIPFKKRGKYYALIERSNQVHRGLLPIMVWPGFLLNGSDLVTGKFMSAALTAAYMVVKGRMIVRLLRQWKRATEAIKESIGQVPSEEKVKAAGGNCPICYEEIANPLMLVCEHIFCESCTTEWFQRESTCPMCRAPILNRRGDDLAFRDGSTSASIYLF